MRQVEVVGGPVRSAAYGKSAHRRSTMCRLFCSNAGWTPSARGWGVGAQPSAGWGMLTICYGSFACFSSSYGRPGMSSWPEPAGWS